MVHKYIEEHRERNPGRIRAILRDLTERIKSDPAMRDRDAVRHFFDDKLAEVTGSRR